MNNEPPRSWEQLATADRFLLDEDGLQEGERVQLAYDLDTKRWTVTLDAHRLADPQTATASRESVQSIYDAMIEVESAFALFDGHGTGELPGTTCVALDDGATLTIAPRSRQRDARLELVGADGAETIVRPSREDFYELNDQVYATLALDEAAS